MNVCDVPGLEHLMPWGLGVLWEHGRHLGDTWDREGSKDEIQENIWKGHSHNLILELAVSYGIPSAIMLFITILILLVISGKILFKKSKDQKYLNLYDRAIWASIFFFLVSQTVDVQYFDGKISIFIGILFAGLKCIHDEQYYAQN